MMRRWVTWVVAHPWLVIAVVAVATLALGWRLPQLRREIDIGALLPPSHPYVQINAKVEREFGGRSLVVLAVVPSRGDAWQPAALRTVKAVTDAVLDLPGVIRQNVVSLSSPNVRSFEDRGGRIEIELLMRDVPETAEATRALRARVEAIPLYRGSLITADGAAGMVVADFWPDRTTQEVALAVESVAERFSDADATVYAAGLPLVMNEISREVLKTQYRFLLSFLGIAVILYCCFRSLQGTLLPLGTGVLAVVWAVGLMAWTDTVMDGWSGMTPILVMAVGAGHSSQILKRYYEEYERSGENRTAVIESTSQIGLVMLAAGSTASLGFLSLVLFRVPSLRNFAVFSAWGIAAAMVLELSFIPACRSLLRPPRAEPRGAASASLLERGLIRVGELTTRRRALAVLGVWAAVVLLGIAGSARISVTSSFKTYIPRESKVRRSVDVVEQHSEGTVPMVIELEGEGGSIPDPRVIRYIDLLTEDLRKEPAVGRVTSVADVLRYVNGVLGSEPGTPSLPDDRELIAQLLFLTYSAPYERFLDRAYGRSAIWASLRTDRTSVIEKAIDRAKSFAAEHPPPSGINVLIAGGMGPGVVAMNEETTRGKVWNIAAIYLVIFMVGGALFRSLVAGLLIVLPLAVSFVFNLGLLGWTGLDLDLTTATILAVAVGIGADYAIYLLYRIREEIAAGLGWEASVQSSLRTSGKAVSIVALSIAGGYAMLSPFHFKPLHLFGILIPTTMIGACASALTLIPALLILFRPRFLARDRRAVVERDPRIRRASSL